MTSWLGLVGAWLLVAGPIYQGALELQSLELARERIVERGKTVPRGRASVWWWLVPPIKMWLEHRHSASYRRAYFDAQDPADAAALLAFFNKALGWLVVALGALLLAVKDTLVFTTARGLPLLAGVAICAGAFLLGILAIIGRISGGKRLLVRDARAAATNSNK